MNDGAHRMVFVRLRTGDMPDKETVLRDLVEQMSLYPDETVFFLNVWCFG